MRHALSRSLFSRCLAVLLLTLPCASVASAAFQGIARDPDSDRFLYREIHCNAPAAGAEVHYLDEDNTPIAGKRLMENFAYIPAMKSSEGAPEQLNPAWVPEYEFVHKDSGFGEAIRYSGKKVILYRREAGTTEWESKSLNPARYDDPMIADAGFDVFIRDHLDRLAAGGSLNVVYLSAPRLDTLGFTLQPINQTDEQITIAMYPTNFVIRLLVDPIRVTYNKSTGQLTRFEGLTNVPRNKESNFIAAIEYQYGEELDAFCR